MVWDIISTITEHITDDNSDNDSFNSAVMDLYDDVLFQYTIIPKEQVEMCSIENKESFISAVSVEGDLDIHGMKEYVLPQPSELFHDGQSQYDEESVNSSHLLSAGTSNDDGLSYITDAMSAMPSPADKDYTRYSALHTDLEESCTSASGVVDSINLDYDEVVFNPSDIDESDIDDTRTTNTTSRSEDYTCSDSVEYFGPSLMF